MADDLNSERLGLRGTLDFISSALRTIGAANATGAIVALTAAFHFFDLPRTHDAIKVITLSFLFGVVFFTFSYFSMYAATVYFERSMGGSSAHQQWEDMLVFPGRMPTAEESRKAAIGTVRIATILGGLSFISFWVGLGFVVLSVLAL